MGRSDVRLILHPKEELQQMWKQLDHEGRTYIESKLGYLVPLIDVDVQTGIMQALPHFWCPQTSTFIFGNHELTPTLEEYSIAIGRPLEHEVITPPIGIEPISILSDFLIMSENDVKRVLKDNCNACPLSFLSACLAKASNFQKSRIFLLAFFGFVIFPYRTNAINPSVAWVVKQVCAGMNFINAILSETFLCLTRFKRGGDKTFHAPILLLQIWFFSHIRKFSSYMIINRVHELDSPILKFKTFQDHTPKLHYSEWISFLKNPSPKVFQWRAKWFRISEARLCHGKDPIPLLGITGATSYYPLRVARQYQVLQELPPPLKPNLFQVQTLDKDSFIHAELAWHDCSPQRLVRPEEELQGKERIYYASARYVRCHVIPAEFLPEIPKVTEKPTRLAEIKRLKRKLEKAEGRVEEVVKKNKQMRRTLVSHLYVDQAK